MLNINQDTATLLEPKKTRKTGEEGRGRVMSLLKKENDGLPFTYVASTMEVLVKK